MLVPELGMANADTGELSGAFFFFNMCEFWMGRAGR